MWNDDNKRIAIWNDGKEQDAVWNDEKYFDVIPGFAKQIPGTQ
jgi:hypothetical protein